MNVWDWVEEYRQQAQARGDADRLRLTQYHPKAYACRETDPERALALFENGRRLAVALSEPWWVLFFDHWRATAYLHFLRDYRTILDLVVQATLEVRKPLFEQHPLRFGIFDDLIAAYLGIDSLGYAEQIGQAIEYLDGAVPAEPDTARYLLLARQRRFAVDRRDLDAADEIARRELALADGDEDGHRSRHFSVFVYAGLCEIHGLRGQWEEVGRLAAVGEELARVVGHQLELSELLTWRAVAALKAGDRAGAQRLLRTATGRFSRLGMPPDAAGFDALSLFHEIEGEPRRMLSVRDQELSLIGGKGRLAYETRVRVVRCRLRGRLGEPVTEDLAAARELARQLRQPEPYLAELERIERGEETPGT
jgi:hypothetical protein